MQHKNTRVVEGLFQTHGLPLSVRSDDGPSFSSAQFEGFLEDLGIEHKKGMPYGPQSNGEVEGSNQTLQKIRRIANLQGKDWKKVLYNRYCSTVRTVHVQLHV